jgi:hypothetical protein
MVHLEKVDRSALQNLIIQKSSSFYKRYLTIQYIKSVNPIIRENIDRWCLCKSQKKNHSEPSSQSESVAAFGRHSLYSASTTLPQAPRVNGCSGILQGEHTGPQRCDQAGAGAVTPA